MPAQLRRVWYVLCTVDEYIPALAEHIYYEEGTFESVEDCEKIVEASLDKDLQSFEEKNNSYELEHIEIGSPQQLVHLDMDLYQDEALEYMLAACDDVYLHFAANDIYTISVSFKYTQEEESYQLFLNVIETDDSYIILST